MARVKRGVTQHARHKKILELAKGFHSGRSRLHKTANEAVLHSFEGFRKIIETLGGVHVVLHRGRHRLLDVVQVTEHAFERAGVRPTGIAGLLVFENGTQQVASLLDGIWLSGEFLSHWPAHWQPALELSIRLFVDFGALFGRTQASKSPPQHEVVENLECSAHYQGRGE